MKENLPFYNSDNFILKPKTPIVTIGPDIAFVYIMRKDAFYTMSPIAQKLSQFYHKDVNKIQFLLEEEYDIFLKNCLLV